MGISELERVVRSAAREKDLNTILSSTDCGDCGKETLPPEFAKATRTLARRKRKKTATTLSLLSPTVGRWG